MTTLDNIDTWCLRGFSGLLNLIAQRLGQPEGFTDRNLAQIRIYQRLLQDYISQMEQRSPGLEKPASVAGIDRWLLAGFEGLFLIVKDRLEDGKLDDNNLNTLKTIHAKIGAIIVSHNKDA